MSDEAPKRQRIHSTTCTICKEKTGKYKCPRCERITCSLECCKKHREAFDCNGKRDRAAFVDLKTFSDSDLLSDYYFLEEANSAVDSACHRLEPAAKKVLKSNAPRRWVRTQEFLRKEPRLIDFALMPRGMSRAKANQTYVDFKEEIVYWTMEWNMYCAVNMDPIVLRTHRVLESSSIRSALKDATENRHKMAELHPIVTALEDATAPLRVRMYCDLRGGNHLVPVDLDMNVGDLVRKLRIIEFPRLVVLASDVPEVGKVVVRKECDMQATEQAAPTSRFEQMG